MFCDVAVQDSAPIMRNHKEAIKHAEGERRHSEEVHCGDGFTVSFRQECEACLCESDSAAEGWSGGDVFCNQGVHVIADTIAKIVADGAHLVQPGDQSVSVSSG